METKAELRALISSLSKEKSSLTEKVESLQKQVDKLKQERFKRWEADEKAYQDFKETKLGEDMMRMIREEIFKIKVECSSDWGGSFGVSVSYDGQELSSDSDCVISQHNPLEE